MPGHAVARIRVQPFPIHRDRLLDFARAIERSAQRIVGSDVSWPQFQDAPVGRLGIVEPAETGQETAFVLPGCRVIGVRLDRARVGTLGIIVAALPTQHHAEIVPGVGMRRHELDHAPICAVRRLELIGFLEDVAEIVQRVGIVRRQPDRPLDAGDAPLALSTLVKQHAEEMQRGDMVAVGREDPLVEATGLRELAGTMERDRPVDVVRSTRDVRGTPMRLFHGGSGASARVRLVGPPRDSISVGYWQPIPPVTSQVSGGPRGKPFASCFWYFPSRVWKRSVTLSVSRSSPPDPPVE